MAFHQPTRQAQAHRVNRVESEDGDSAILTPQAQPAPSESQTWVLFTPGTDAETTTSYLSSIQDDQVTPGRSRISLLGSLDSVARSDHNSQPENSAVPSDFLSESFAEDDAELDSLDSHLPDFRSIPSPYAQQQEDAHTAPVLPAHDGLGSFRFDTRGMGAEAQNWLYAFEKFNPNQVKHTRESFDRIRVELDNDEAHEVERNRRIEAWRLEQSQLLLENIRKETRRRQSEASLHNKASPRSVVDRAVLTSSPDETARDVDAAGTEWHDQDSRETEDPRSGFWSQITRKVICGLLGIDDKLLEILFGEALPADEDLSSAPKASAMSTPTPAVAHMVSESFDDSTWQLRMLERLARELGLLVHRMSAHPGAFSTYTRMQQAPLPYAGLTVIPEAPADMNETQQKADGSVSAIPQFKPTVAHPVDIPGARPSESPTPTGPSVGDMSGTNTQHAFTQQEWEQDLDIKLVFRYFRSRFTPSRPSTPPFASGTSHLATSSTQDSAAKAARVRQHHPLVSHAHAHHRPRQGERRTFKVTTPSSPVALRHPSGSCASQSTRRSARRGSVSSRHSSRHYWDIGGSIGAGSIVASTGPMGSWGEV
ncbi:hypothetical protein B0H66DRAFT_138890 [Apodospora peruviana]|uniref:Uncharacterized protein n=1 Tax=Apodospora peruviana TaxID=516989 RepID=A0AAE0MAU4_9PEZI|nr:hypothetical protein B0H66DRAFT_138890 [Apodospora peruviana]